MLKTNTKLVFLYVCALALGIVGCSKADLKGRVPISGKVTLNGTPLKDGEILFDPIGSQQMRSQSGGKIHDGKYSLPAEFGLVPGEYAVRISSMEEVPGTRVESPNLELNVEYRNLVPPKFGSASEQKVTVTNTGKQTFDFAM